MGDTNELIVRFKRGVTEDDARARVTRAGGKVRRRMRTDHADEVMLLVRVEGGEIADLEARIRKDATVDFTEVNQSGFGPR